MADFVRTAWGTLRRAGGTSDDSASGTVLDKPSKVGLVSVDKSTRDDDDMMRSYEGKIGAKKSSLPPLPRQSDVDAGLGPSQTRKVLVHRSGVCGQRLDILVIPQRSFWTTPSYPQAL